MFAAQRLVPGTVGSCSVGRSSERPTAGARRSTDLDTGETADKAGAYGVQGAGAALAARVEGSDTIVVGLPLTETVALLRQVGLDVLRQPS